MLVTALEQHPRAISLHVQIRESVGNRSNDQEWDCEIGGGQFTSLCQATGLIWTPGTLEGSTHPPAGPAMRSFGFCGQ